VVITGFGDVDKISLKAKNSLDELVILNDNSDSTLKIGFKEK